MKTILVTGASGYVGSLLIKKLINHENGALHIIGTDIRPRYFTKGKNKFTFKPGDLTTGEVAELIGQYRPEVVIHLAAIVAPAPEMKRDLIFDVEVEGTRRLLEACIRYHVSKFITSSSGAAYGYHHDNPDRLKEDDALRGNEEFAYSWHKRLVEEILEDYRNSHPALKQVIFRISTVLGENTRNDITRLFHQKRITGLKGTDTPFVIIWDEDLLECLVTAALTGVEGIYNIAGDGVITLREMAGIIGKPFRALPAGLVRTALAIAKPLKLSRYGPEQVKFLQYRPVLDNRKLKEEFAYMPRKTSREAFLYYAEKNGLV
jgi:UDP-glucose 4-epimerase